MESSNGSSSQCLTTSASTTTNASTTNSSTSSSALTTTSLSTPLALTTHTSSGPASTSSAIVAPGCSTPSTISSSCGATNLTSVSGSLAATNLTTSGGAFSAAAASSFHQHTPLLQILPLDTGKHDDSNNLSLASGISEGQRSLSAAPSASSSPILSPPNKIFGRNANGTMVATSRPNNEAEIQLYRVLQKASLLAYYDTLLEMGGDDVQQLYEAGEEEFLEIMALVGMASKPLHVRRLQKALHEWALNPGQFQQPLNHNAGQFETPAKSSTCLYNAELSRSPGPIRPKYPTFNPSAPFNPTPLVSTVAPGGGPASSAHLLSQICSSLPSLPIHNPSTSHVLPPTTSLTHASERPQALVNIPQMPGSGVPSNTAHQVSSSSPQLTPVLSEMQVARITMGAEKIAAQLPQREPRAHTSKKRTSRELEQVMAMSENDPRRMDEIRKYSAIYGRFDCKRRPEKPLTLHEVCVNEAAAQLCRLVPALLTRRDELFPLARQIVKDAGFGHSASIARYGNLLSQMVGNQQNASGQIRSASAMLECESNDTTNSSTPNKRQRLASSDATLSAADSNRDSVEDPRYNLFAMYQKFAAKPPFDLADIAKFTLTKPHDFDDQDQESRFSFSNSSSPSMPVSMCFFFVEYYISHLSLLIPYETTVLNINNGPEEDRNVSSLDKLLLKSNDCVNNNNNLVDLQTSIGSPTPSSTTNRVIADLSTTPTKTRSLSGDVQVISAAGSHIIAVANPALAMSPTLQEAISLKREASSPDQ
ncbi:NGFI-A-binding protein homolog [Musca autumnalis]|uniref:NGFI-A-binding protein homolog n=1 Tax=Musca autumnalis TaxID=221902 RepID=UPI003CEE9C85